MTSNWKTGPWSGFVLDDPETAYYGFQNQFGKSPNQKKYFQNQFANIQNQFMGKQAQQVMGGQEPTEMFVDYLAKFFAPQGGAAQAWGSMSPGQKGMDFGRYAPPTRWRM